VNFKPIKWLNNWKAYSLIKKSGLFNTDYYLDHYPDVKKTGLDPILHFINFGWKEGKNPSDMFNTSYYLKNNEDVAIQNINPLVHYIQFGRLEGRSPAPLMEDKLNNYQDWVELYDTFTDTDKAEIRSHITALKHRPLISILMPADNTPELWLRGAIDSTLSQLYPNWELCISADASSELHVRQLLDTYSCKDPRVKVTYLETNGQIAVALNAALALCSGKFIGLLNQDSILREHALYLIVNELNVHPDADILYSDEDMIDRNGKRHSPFFKPDWDPEKTISEI